MGELFEWHMVRFLAGVCREFNWWFCKVDVTNKTRIPPIHV